MKSAFNGCRFQWALWHFCFS